MRRLALLASLVLACGDNRLGTGAPLAPAAELVVVAHPDDDLLLVQPDLLEAVQRPGGTTVVYVTRGSDDADAATRRYAGARAAYGHAAGDDDWQCGLITLGEQAAEHCRLADRGVSLVFLGMVGRELRDAAAGPARAGLIAMFAELVRDTRPRVVRTHEIPRTHGRDHADHTTVGALVVLALAEAQTTAELVAYRGDAIIDEPPNLSMPLFERTAAMLARYDACDTGCAACGEPCNQLAPLRVAALLRRYAIGFRPRAGGRLRANNQCISDNLALVTCPAAPIWTLDRAGELRAHDDCLTVEPSGELAMQPCVGGTARRFFVDDEGHILSGMPPARDGEPATGPLWCLASAAGRAALQPCGSGPAPTWELVPDTVETDRETLGITATGREVRLGDLTGDNQADLCAIESGLVCSPGTGLGGFATTVRIDDPAAPLAIDPRSLVLGDVDGDGRTDACGREADGILCATAAANFAAQRWTFAFADATARTGTSASLVAIDTNADDTLEICGVDASGVACAAESASAETQLLSSWPPTDAVVWIADLDGDRNADWCAATDTGPACAVFAQRELTTDGAPWGFAQDGTFEIAPATTATVALADIDGDGRADLCSPREDRIVCARSQGRAFGPRATTLAILPNQSVASALWLGDLDGDGRADPCADTGPTIVCAVQP